MKVIRPSQVEKLQPGNTALFTGPVSLQPLVPQDTGGNFKLVLVNFGKGVRNKFHAHSGDQVLIVTSGKGIVATEQEEVVVEVGDVIQFPAGEKHWHGATKDSEFSHIFIAYPKDATSQLED